MVLFKFRPNQSCNLWVVHKCQDLDEAHRMEICARELEADYKIIITDNMVETEEV